MIVGFDNDDASIFEEQFRFIQEARIPISMTGMLNAVPKTPLYARLQAAGRLVAESVGDQFVFTNVMPMRMSLTEMYEGYKQLLHRLYDYRNYRRRTMALILNKGAHAAVRARWRGEHGAIFARMLWHCIVRASPRRAWLTFSMMRRDRAAAAALDSRRDDAGPHAQAPLRVHAGNLAAHRRPHRRAEEAARVVLAAAARAFALVGVALSPGGQARTASALTGPQSLGDACGVAGGENVVRAHHAGAVGDADRRRPQRAGQSIGFVAAADQLADERLA